MVIDANPNDALALRRGLGQFTTGVAVVTTLGADGHPLGLTINSFSSVSLAPPLVNWNLQRRSANRQAFLEASHFAINVLSASQQALSRRFASHDATDRFDGLGWRPGIGGVPLLDGALAWLECRLVSSQTVGDHELFLGEVLQCFSQADAAPLVYWQGRYHRLLEASPESA